MKVFEVITEAGSVYSKEITRRQQYVTAQNDDMRTVVNYFHDSCEQCGEQLISITETCTIVQNLEDNYNK